MLLQTKMNICASKTQVSARYICYYQLYSKLINFLYNIMSALQQDNAGGMPENKTTISFRNELVFCVHKHAVSLSCCHSQD